MAKKKKSKKPKKQKKPLTAAQKRAKRERNKNFMTIFINGKQKRVPRPPAINGMDVDEFIQRNADPIWLHMHGMWELIPVEEDWSLPTHPRMKKVEKEPVVDPDWRWEQREPSPEALVWQSFDPFPEWEREEECPWIAIVRDPDESLESDQADYSFRECDIHYAPY